LFTFTNLASDPDATYAQIQSALDDLLWLRFMTIFRDLGYGLGIVAMLRSIRQTAQENEHYPLRDAADRVTNLTAGLVLLDIPYQWLFGGSGNPIMALYLMIFGIIAGFALIVFWVYCHLRLAKFLKAAAILVHEPHNPPGRAPRQQARVGGARAAERPTQREPAREARRGTRESTLAGDRRRAAPRRGTARGDGTWRAARRAQAPALAHFASGQPKPFAASTPSHSSRWPLPRHSWCLRNSSVNCSQCVLGTIWKLSVAIGLLSDDGPFVGSVFPGTP
jgi:hypothetical protein